MTVDDQSPCNRGVADCESNKTHVNKMLENLAANGKWSYNLVAQ